MSKNGVTQLPNDAYGRLITVQTINGQDVYVITDPNNPQLTFSVSFTTGTPQANVYQTINSMPASVPPPPPPTAMEVYTAIMQEAITFGQGLMVQFAAQNVMAGITQAGQTLPIINYTTTLSQCLTTGSLYAAISTMNTMIADSSATKTALAPFVTNDILYSYLNQVQAYLNVPLTPNPGP